MDQSPSRPHASGRMRRIVVAVALALLGGLAAEADDCARDNVPAAALLVPFAQVGVRPDNSVDPDGATTILRITNVGDDAQIVHLTVWDMFARPVIVWDVVLSGYDVVQFNLRDVVAGRFDLLAPPPAWSSDPTYGTQFDEPLQQRDVEYTPAQMGPDSQGGATLAAPEDRPAVAPYPGECSKFPYGNYSSSLACFRDLIAWPLRATKEGPIPHDKSYNSKPGSWLEPENITLDTLTFYVTAEVVRDCSLLFPDDERYWASPSGPLPAASNVLTGHVLLLDPRRGLAEAMPAVAIEAGGQGAPGWGYYDQYAAPHGAAAPYEPLATAFALPFEQPGGATSMTSSVLLFSTRPSFLAPRRAPETWCHEAVASTFEEIDDRGYALYAWDMDELPMAPPGVGGCPFTCPAPPAEPNVLPFATQRVPITAANFDLPSAGGGWMLLALPASYETYAPASEPRSDGATAFEPIANRTGAMGWAGVELVMTPAGSARGSSALLEATVLGNRHCFAGDVLPGLNTDKPARLPRRRVTHDR